MNTSAATYQTEEELLPAVPSQAPADPTEPTITRPAPQVQVPVVTEKKSSLKETVIFGVLGAAAVTISFFLLRKLYRDFVSGREESKSLDTDSTANTAKRIKMAFDNDGWPGTDEEKLREILRSIKSKKEWEDIGTSFNRLYSVPLMRMMEDELTSSEYSEMMAIVNSKPDKEGQQVVLKTQIENWARRLYAAFTVWYWNMIPGTDEDAVRSVFIEIPTQSVFAQVAAAYQNLYGSKFMDDLKGDMDDWADYMKIITAKPQS